MAKQKQISLRVTGLSSRAESIGYQGSICYLYLFTPPYNENMALNDSAYQN